MNKDKKHVNPADVENTPTEQAAESSENQEQAAPEPTELEKANNLLALKDEELAKEKKEYIKDQLENHVWESELRREVPHVHYVDRTEKVYNRREERYEKFHGGTL